jgi:hypothetical protein
MKAIESGSRLLRRNIIKSFRLLVLGSGLVIISLPLLANSLAHSQYAYANVNATNKPTLQTLEQVTDQAFGDPKHDDSPDSWGMHKTRVVRMSTGDLFMTYISTGSGKLDREWHLMHKAPGGSWQEVHTGDAGEEPINIVRGPHDELHLFAWPGTKGQLQHIESKDLGKTYTTETLAGNWLGAPNTEDSNEQGYSSAAVNDQGDIVICQIGEDTPGVFNWSYYTPTTNSWTFHSNTLDKFRFAYLFLFPGDNGDLSIVGMRDVHREELGYTKAPSNDFDYVFDELGYFHISDVTNPTVTETIVAQVKPKNNTDYDLTYQSDVYADTQGRIHILYDNMYDGPHEAIVQNNAVVKDVKLTLPSSDPSPTKMSMIQDAAGNFYIVDVSNDGNSLYVYPEAAGDTDGTQLAAPTTLDISKYPSCTDDDFCHAPAFAEPRSGSALSNTLDGTYGNFTKEMYFRIQLPDSGTSTPTPSPTLTATATTTPGTTPTATPTPPPATYRYSFEDGTTDQWSLNHADSLTNSTSYAFDGTHSLKLVVKSVTANGYANASINAAATGSPAMPAVGQTVSAQVYLPSGAPQVQAVVFVKDSAGTKFYTSYDQVPNLPTGKWTQLQFTVPTAISGTVAEYGVRFQFPAKSSSSLNAYIDAVNW